MYKEYGPYLVAYGWHVPALTRYLEHKHASERFIDILMALVSPLYVKRLRNGVYLPADLWKKLRTFINYHG